ncbi:unnamed protein product [Toxocara canis]|uniref:DUF1758 domain-containing protein n=1 Tax=Toxocara canis TaxID=6265 RepID=A0A183UQM1_TOXCA|nr:unnamed protein product [Toxocara canis]
MQPTPKWHSQGRKRVQLTSLLTTLKLPDLMLRRRLLPQKARLADILIDYDSFIDSIALASIERIESGYQLISVKEGHILSSKQKEKSEVVRAIICVEEQLWIRNRCGS